MAEQAQAPSAASISVRRSVVSCWLCGVRMQSAQMVSDGGDACLDLRWYCKDVRACTTRWASRHSKNTQAASEPEPSAAG